MNYSGLKSEKKKIVKLWNDGDCSLLELRNQKACVSCALWGSIHDPFHLLSGGSFVSDFM